MNASGSKAWDGPASLSPETTSSDFTQDPTLSSSPGVQALPCLEIEELCPRTQPCRQRPRGMEWGAVTRDGHQATAPFRDPIRRESLRLKAWRTGNRTVQLRAGPALASLRRRMAR